MFECPNISASTPNPSEVMATENEELWSSKHLSREHRRAEARSKRVPRKMPFAVLLLMMVAVAGACFFFAGENDFVAVVATVLVSIGCLTGFSFGLSKVLGSLIGIGTAVAFAPGLAASRDGLFTEWFGTTGILNRWLMIGAIGLLIAIVVAVIASAILKFILESRPWLSQVNGWLGFAAGGLKAVVAILFTLGGIQAIAPLYQTQHDQIESGLQQNENQAVQRVTSAVLMVDEKTRESRLGPVVQRWNPFELIPQLNQFENLQKAVTVMSDPKQVENLLQHPSIQDFSDDPEVKKTIDELLQSEDFQEMFKSETIDQHAVMQVLGSPQILKLVEQPGFLNKAMEIIDQTEVGASQ